MSGKSQTPVAIGIDLGGTYIKGGVVDPSGATLDRRTRDTRAETGLEGVTDGIVELVTSLREANDIHDSRLLGVGVGIPGVTTPEGVVVLAPNLHWHNVPFLEVLKRKLTGRVEVDNDACVAALGEARIGVGSGCRQLVLITLGTGIGGGIVLDGSIYHGASHSAGEIGHVCIIPDGPTCACGKPGCLEALASGPAMVRRMKEAMGSGSRGDVTPQSICAMASEGHAVASDVVRQTATYIGIAVANIINLYSPEVIAIGGGISAAGSVLLDPIIESTRANTLEGLFDYTRIQLATLGNDAGYLGAAHLVM